MKNFTEKEIQELIKDYGWSEKDTRKGYSIFVICGISTSVIEGALMVEAIGDIGKFESDFEACRQAEKDGVKFINDIDGLEKGCYVDTKENRERCIKALELNPNLRIENQIQEHADGWEEYKEHFGYKNA